MIGNIQRDTHSLNQDNIIDIVYVLKTNLISQDLFMNMIQITLLKD